jgi:NAD(P)-dependent dehydrogenase (short-subunit alcohol dehydrogenase family)
MPTGIITGASRGLGLALARSLATDGWRVVIDGRDAAVLRRAAEGIGGDVTAIAGDVAHRVHRRELVEAAGARIDLLVNNASSLGLTPLRPLAATPLEAVARVFAVNVLAPLELAQLVLPRMPDGGVIVNLSSDAAVEAYEHWGPYGSSKAALDHLSAILAAEQPALRIHAVDPGDMATQMHADALPEDDLSALAGPDDVVPALRVLIDGGRPSGRHRAGDLVEAAA